MTIDLMKRYSANGYIFHSNRSCKSTAFGIFDIMGIIAEKTGIPGMTVDADMGDPLFFSEDAFRMRLENYLELLDSKSYPNPA